DPHVHSDTAVAGDYSLIRFFAAARSYRELLCFPTRRSFDLPVPVPEPLAHEQAASLDDSEAAAHLRAIGLPSMLTCPDCHGTLLDRKSTRLNSSHVEISYAVFCLKQKNPLRMRLWYAMLSRR